MANEFERVWKFKGIEGMLDTDYASNVVSLNESDISDDTMRRRRLTEAGKGANMVRGKTWRSKTVSARCSIRILVVSLCVLDSLSSC